MGPTENSIHFFNEKSYDKIPLNINEWTSAIANTLIFNEKLFIALEPGFHNYFYYKTEGDVNAMLTEIFLNDKDGHIGSSDKYIMI